MQTPAMNDDQLLRYARQIVLSDIDTTGQARLAQARVLIVGVGGLGNPVASLLAAMGVGHLTLVDHDQVDTTNLARQLLFRQSDVGRDKVEVAAKRLRDLNPHVAIHPIKARADHASLSSIVATHDIVIDATDHFAIRDTLNVVCWQARRTWIFGAATGWSGQTTTFAFGHTDGADAVASAQGSHRPTRAADHRSATAAAPPPLPQSGCYRCLYGDAADDVDGNTCVTTGVIATATHWVATLQANDAVRLLLGHGSNQHDVLHVADFRHGTFQRFRRHRDPRCPVCAAQSHRQD